MHNLTLPILKILADGCFHSGSALANQLNTSRANVWNAVHVGIALGAQVSAVRGRGYKLTHPVFLLNQAEVIQLLGDEYAWLKFELHDSLASTNSYLLERHTQHAHCVAAQLQTHGRGRQGRTWLSALGSALTFSVLWNFQQGISALSGLSLAVGVALIRALHAHGYTDTMLKWPNDVLLNHKKLAGILIEVRGDMEFSSTAVIGIGINLRLNEAWQKQLPYPATDLGQPSINPNLLLASLLKMLAQVLNEFSQHGFASLREEWLSYHAYQHKEVILHHANGHTQHGLVQDVSTSGALLVNTALGLQHFVAGDISLRSPPA